MANRVFVSKAVLPKRAATGLTSPVTAVMRAAVVAAMITAVGAQHLAQTSIVIIMDECRVRDARP